MTNDVILPDNMSKNKSDEGGERMLKRTYYYEASLISDIEDMTTLTGKTISEIIRGSVRQYKESQQLQKDIEAYEKKRAGAANKFSGHTASKTGTGSKILNIVKKEAKKHQSGQSQPKLPE
jgi:hypothetical protein